MFNHPKVTIQKSRTDKVIENTGWAVIGLTWLVVLLFYFDLPDQIPIHFNHKGEVDGIGGKSLIWLLPAISIPFYYFLGYLLKFYNLFNYPVKVTKENAQILYGHTCRMIRVLNLIIVLLFGLITVMSLLTAKGIINQLGIWFLPLALVSIFGTMIYFYIKLFKVKKKFPS